MNAQDVIDALRSASVDEIAQIRVILRVPDEHYVYRDMTRQDIPRNLGDLWNRRDTASIVANR